MAATFGRCHDLEIHKIAMNMKQLLPMLALAKRRWSSLRYYRRRKGPGEGGDVEYSTLRGSSS